MDLFIIVIVIIRIKHVKLSQSLRNGMVIHVRWNILYTYCTWCWLNPFGSRFICHNCEPSSFFNVVRSNYATTPKSCNMLVNQSKFALSSIIILSVLTMIGFISMSDLAKITIASLELIYFVVGIYYNAAIPEMTSFVTIIQSLFALNLVITLLNLIYRIYKLRGNTSSKDENYLQLTDR